MAKKLIFIMVWFGSLTLTAQELLVQPYLQPGNSATLSKEQKVLIWQTDSIPGSFKVEYAEGTSLEGARKVLTGKIESVSLRINRATTLLYRSQLTGLDFDAGYFYRVSLNGKTVSESSFTSRSKKNTLKFVAFGDCGTGSPEQKAIAYQIYLQKPQFALVVGDIVYNSGLMHEYQRRFFPVYRADTASPEEGAPLLQSIPFYMMMGNHDVQARDLDKTQGGLSYFYYNDLPLNGPQLERMVKVQGSPERVEAFKKATDGRFPYMSNFSFNYGNVHFTCIDANAYTNPLDPELLIWMRKDLSSSKADWKIVTFHQPGFNTSPSHYDDQYFRLLAPFFEQLNVDLVINGHVHNYQRSRPLKFDPKKSEDGARYIISDAGRVDGKFTMDEKFDGITHTKPEGIIYIVSGGGGAALYDVPMSNKPELWKHEPPENWVPFTVKMISDIHSFTLIETEGQKLMLKQLDAQGKILDEITVTK